MISSYGTYQGVSGARVIGAAGCLKGGGTGLRAQRTMQLTGSHTEPTAPPFGGAPPTTT